MFFHEYAYTPGGMRRIKIQKQNRRSSPASSSSESMDDLCDPYAYFEQRVRDQLRDQRRSQTLQRPVPYYQNPYHPPYHPSPQVYGHYYHPPPVMSRHERGRAHSIGSDDEYFPDGQHEHHDYRGYRNSHSQKPKNNDHNVQNQGRKQDQGNANNIKVANQTNQSNAPQGQNQNHNQNQNKNQNQNAGAKQVRTFDRACKFLHQTLDQSIHFFEGFIEDFTSDFKFASTTPHAIVKQQWQERIKFHETHGSEDLEHTSTGTDGTDSNQQSNYPTDDTNLNPHPLSAPLLSFHELREQIKRHIKDLLASKLPPAIAGFGRQEDQNQNNKNKQTPNQNQNSNEDQDQPSNSNNSHSTPNTDNTYEYYDFTEQQRTEQEQRRRTADRVVRSIKAVESDVMKLLDDMALDHIDAETCLEELKDIKNKVDRYRKLVGWDKKDSPSQQPPR